MPQSKGTAIALMIIGILVIVISLAADPLGLGAQPATIGWKQWLGAAAGIVLVGLGWWWRQQATRSEAEA